VDPAKLATSNEAKLTADEGLLVMAFVKLLHASATDPIAKMARRVSETLLDPWYEQSKKELSEQIHEHFGQASEASKQAGGAASKLTGKNRSSPSQKLGIQFFSQPQVSY
jgi:hypothetical protein